MAVKQGMRVKRGDIIGYVGDTGRSTGSHLHYSVFVNNVPVNPRKYLKKIFG
jgi:murein DD-endopeptidase MepM/ murein hydrolase activator NlpD